MLCTKDSECEPRGKASFGIATLTVTVTVITTIIIKRILSRYLRHCTKHFKPVKHSNIQMKIPLTAIINERIANTYTSLYQYVYISRAYYNVAECNYIYIEWYFGCNECSRANEPANHSSAHKCAIYWRWQWRCTHHINPITMYFLNH